MIKQFKYKLVTSEGEILTGEQEAENSVVLQQTFENQGYHVLKLEQSSSFFDVLAKWLPISSVSRSEIQLFSKELAILLKAGLPLVTSLQILIEHISNSRFKNVLISVKKSVEGGSSLSDALSKFPKLFTPLYISSVKSGETADTLVEILIRLHDHLKLVGNLNRRVRSALIYPAFLIIIAGSAMAYLLLFVVPVFSKLYRDMGSALPLPTQILLQISYGVKSVWWLIPLVVIGFIFFWKKWAKKTQIIEWLHNILLRLPFIGETMQRYTIAQLSRSLATLIGNGVPLPQALETSSSIISNRILHKKFSSSLALVQGGMSLANALKQTEIIPSLTIQMIHTGEQTGSLEEMLTSTAEVYEEETQTKISNLISALEPVLMLIMGIMVAAILLAMYLPIFELSGHVS